MTMDERFFQCDVCGNLIVTLIASGVIPECCGEKMTQIKANTTDGAREKHVPLSVYVAGCKLKVCVGSVAHPMTDQHHISFICLETQSGFVVHYLNPGDVPTATFCYSSRPIAVYAYCNLHGLWRADVPELKRCVDDEYTDSCGKFGHD